MDQRLVTVNLDNKDTGLMVDISEGGVAVQTQARIKLGATAALQFELPDRATRIDTSGTVAWVDATTGRVGICFEGLPAASAEGLKQWIGRQPSREQAKPQLYCRACGSSDVRPSEHHIVERFVLRMLHMRAYRCRACWHRFYASTRYFPHLRA